MLAGRGLAKGDTIIEVLLAITVFSLVAIATITIMNQGVNTTQRALEITQVRQQIDSQVDALQAAHQAYSVLPDGEKVNSEWKKIISTNGGANTTSINDTTGCPAQSQMTGDLFIMDTTTATLLDSSALKSITSDDVPVVYSQLYDGAAYGLWIERVKYSKPGFLSAYDFRVRACWVAAGMTITNPMQIETTVRLYDVSE